MLSSLLNWEKAPADMPVPITSPSSSSATTGSGVDTNGFRDQPTQTQKSHAVSVDDVEMYIASNVDPADYYLLL